MKALEFKSTVTQAGHITLPPEIAREIPMGEQVRIVVMWDPSGIDLAWQSAGRERFEAAYAPDDSVYEELIQDAQRR